MICFSENFDRFMRQFLGSGLSSDVLSDLRAIRSAIRLPLTCSNWL